MNTLEVERQEARYKHIIYSTEAYLKHLSGAMVGNCFPITHTFADGVYIREVRIPKGMMLVGKLHRDSYLNFIPNGDMAVMSLTGVKRVKGPCWMVAEPGTKRVGYSFQDTTWITVHSNPLNLRDIDALEEGIHLPEPPVYAHQSREGLDLFIKEVNALNTNQYLEDIQSQASELVLLNVNEEEIRRRI